MSNCAYVLNGGSKDTRVHANLPIPPELCEGTLHVHVNGNTQAGKTHVGVNTTLTGDPINVQASVP